MSKCQCSWLKVVDMEHKTRMFDMVVAHCCEAYGMLDRWLCGDSELRIMRLNEDEEW